MKTSEASQLPEYKVEEFTMYWKQGSFTMLEITCPRCGVEFWARTTWRMIYNVVYTTEKGKAPARPHGRSCPYCFAASAIPEEWRVYTNKERPKAEPPKPRRIVRRRRSTK